MPNKKENGDINYIVRPSCIKKTLKESGRQYTVKKVYLQKKARHYRWHGGDPLLKTWQSFSSALMSFSLLWYQFESLVREEHTLFHQGLFLLYFCQCNKALHSLSWELERNSLSLNIKVKVERQIPTKRQVCLSSAWMPRWDTRYSTGIFVVRYHPADFRK